MVEHSAATHIAGFGFEEVGSGWWETAFVAKI